MFDITDLHNHSLFDLDDGAESYDMMCRMIEESYASGVRHICFTPHYLNADACDCTLSQIADRLRKAREYCEKNLPDMRLSAGSEMVYHYDFIDSIEQKKLLTLANSRYVLTDFLATPDARSIVSGVERMLSSGYVPVVAHVERYSCLYDKVDVIRRMCEAGAIIQINAGSLFLRLFSKRRRLCYRLLSEGLVDVVASDAHDLTFRGPSLKKAVELVISKFGIEYAEYLFNVIPQKIISNQRLVM
jgi:protein-tyrosine phosphatase